MASDKVLIAVDRETAEVALGRRLSDERAAVAQADVWAEVAAALEDDDGPFVDIRDIADDLQEVLRVFYATADLTEESVGAAEKLDALISEDEDRPPAPELISGVKDALNRLTICEITDDA
jgi:hypothetical protein